ncbi:uncharacterized protein BDR25DRAFT_349785 [Lindgomyces ingoldianus]|uniref:Uncharacterized protein n=1 Tax=Lindgomyces ingoldianus TaxID=673940 RepID=A0ACB6RC56_9PLEO|nr:uncharacterized protein BDR25DRAFT_349785 [Lindgomyces ingoldianus]KAF2476726.1 hypothetical protein BDR25DRAFT_349785 [Lindgomyces ingoldianus]
MEPEYQKRKTTTLKASSIYNFSISANSFEESISSGQPSGSSSFTWECARRKEVYIPFVRRMGRGWRKVKLVVFLVLIDVSLVWRILSNTLPTIKVPSYSLFWPRGRGSCKGLITAGFLYCQAFIIFHPELTLTLLSVSLFVRRKVSPKFRRVTY